MQVLLRINLGDAAITVDDDLVKKPLAEPLAGVARAQHYLGGEVEISDQGREPLQILDDLEQLVPRLCLQALARLEQGEAVTIPLFTDPAKLTLTPKGDQLEIEAPDGRRDQFPLAAALVALEACGARFAHLLELNFPGDEGRERKLAPMRLVLMQREDARLRDAPPPDMSAWADKDV
ncbi:hypothetical protein SNE35_27830 [Paucibacter sp. R3-3]|uniref:Uncharacterized protein n=1 Tax=Roseateles agri TaxID=3098619 RepID=A0ABU5DPU7_9BURK|nr:hypothetical protein [Paucibacter sp. R3-3]MDY0748340.1 hypothetical protein [Paucibacter sp. R3-3]